MENEYVLVGRYVSCHLSEDPMEEYEEFFLWTLRERNNILEWEKRLDILHDFDPSCKISWPRRNCKNMCCSTWETFQDFKVIRNPVSEKELKLILEMYANPMHFKFKDFEKLLTKAENQSHGQYVTRHCSLFEKILGEFLPASLCAVIVDYLLPAKE